MAFVDASSVIPLPSCVIGAAPSSNRILSAVPIRSSVTVLALNLKKRASSSTQVARLQYHKVQSSPVRCVDQSNFVRVIIGVWKVGKSGIEAGSKLVPDVVPRPIARIAVIVVALAVAIFVLKSFISTMLFALAVVGLSYFAFIALNNIEGSKGSGGTTSVEDSLEEARRIMDKYK